MYPNYFSRFPTIKYPYKINRAGVTDTITIKDYFHLQKVRENILDLDTIYSPVTIINGERPDQLAGRMYQDTGLYWVILQVNDIIDVYNEWPMNNQDLDEYILRKYGSYEKSNDIHHYETIETFDGEGNRVLPGRGGSLNMDRNGRAESGLRVPENFTFTYRLYPNQPLTRTLKGTRGANAAVTPVTNRQYEYDVNEDKSQVWILQKKYLSQYLQEVQNYVTSISDIDAALEVSDR